MLTLYSYWRSSASYRVRIALSLKGLQYETRGVDLLRDAHLDPSYREVNPEARVPALVHDGRVISQSLAIIEYLEELYPQPPLLPQDPAGRARVRGLAQIIASEISPLQNLGVRQYLKAELGFDEQRVSQWCAQWIAKGFAALETRLAREPQTGAFSHGDAPTMADCVLVPQCYAARRFGVDVAQYPNIARIEAVCLHLEEFRRAAPEMQPDAS